MNPVMQGVVLSFRADSTWYTAPDLFHSFIRTSVRKNSPKGKIPDALSMMSGGKGVTGCFVAPNAGPYRTRDSHCGSGPGRFDSGGTKTQATRRRRRLPSRYLYLLSVGDSGTCSSPPDPTSNKPLRSVGEALASAALVRNSNSG